MRAPAGVGLHDGDWTSAYPILSSLFFLSQLPHTMVHAIAGCRVHQLVYIHAVTNVYAAHDAISPRPRASALLAARNSCSSTRTVPCAAAMRVLRRLRRSGGRGMPMAVRTMRLRCVLLQDRGGAWHALLRSQSAHRNETAQQAGCCQQGPMLPHARIVERGPAYTGFYACV